MEVWAHTCILHRATVPTCTRGSGEQRLIQAGGTRRQLADKGCSSCSKGWELAMKSFCPTNFALNREERKNLLECPSTAETHPAGSAVSHALQSWLRSSLWAESPHFCSFNSRKLQGKACPYSYHKREIQDVKIMQLLHIFWKLCLNHICPSPMLASLVGQPM